MFEWARYITAAEFSDILSKAADTAAEYIPPQYKKLVKGTYHVISKGVIPTIKGFSTANNSNWAPKIIALETLDFLASGFTMYYSIQALDEEGNVANENMEALCAFLNLAALLIHSYSSYQIDSKSKKQSELKLQESINTIEVVVDKLGNDVLDHEYRIIGLERRNGSDIPPLNKKYKGSFFGTSPQELEKIDNASSSHYLTEISRTQQGRKLQQVGLSGATNEPIQPYLAPYKS